MNAYGIASRGIIENWIQDNSKDRAQDLSKGIVPFMESFKVDDLLFFTNVRDPYYLVVVLIIIMDGYSRIF